MMVHVHVVHVIHVVHVVHIHVVHVVGPIVSMHRSICQRPSVRVIIVAIETGCIESARHFNYSAADAYKFDTKREGGWWVVDVMV
jgi:hypothetical protein